MAEATLRSVRLVNLRHDARYGERRSHQVTTIGAPACRRRFGSGCAQLTIVRQALRPRHEHRPRFECLTRRRVQRLRLTICTDLASELHDLRERILPTGKMVLLRLRLGSSATCMQRETRVRPSAVRPGISKRNRHELPLCRPTHASTRQGAGCRARRPSRLVQRKTDGVTPLAGHSFRTLLQSRQAARRLSARTWMRLAGEPFDRWADWPSIRSVRPHC